MKRRGRKERRERCKVLSVKTCLCVFSAYFAPSAFNDCDLIPFDSPILVAAQGRAGVSELLAVQIIALCAISARIDGD